VAQTLLDQGFQHVEALLGGFNDWLNAGYPVEPKEEEKREEKAA
jgi:rhodanese-related sulfurtransferase